MPGKLRPQIIINSRPKGANGDSCYVYIAYASDASGANFTMTFDASLNYIAILNSSVAIASPEVGDFAGLWKDYKGATGADSTVPGPPGPSGADSTVPGPAGADSTVPGPQGNPGVDGANAFVYIGYASDDTGTGFTLTFDPLLNYIAVLSTDTEIVSPVVGDFTGLLKNYKGATGADSTVPGPQGDPGVDGQGVPAGGAIGKVLKKVSAADFDTEWGDASTVAGLNDLTDVTITTPADAEVLQYEEATSQWKNKAIGQTAFSGWETPTETPDGTITNFSTSGMFANGLLIVTRNGQVQQVGIDFTQDVDYFGYTFNTAPATGQIIRHWYIKNDTILVGGATKWKIMVALVGTKDASNLIFTTSTDFTSGSTIVFVNGIAMTKGLQYNEVGTNGVTFTAGNAPISTDDLDVVYQEGSEPVGNAQTLGSQTLATVVSASTHSAIEKTTLADDDEFSFLDSASSFVLKRLSFLNLKLKITDWNNPIGTIRSFAVSTNPATLLGFGTWAVHGAGRVDVCISASDTEFDTLNETYGEKRHLLLSSESGVPAHTHSYTLNVAGVGTLAPTLSGSTPVDNANTNNNIAANAASAHNNIQPSIVSYRWVRTD